MKFIKKILYLFIGGAFSFLGFCQLSGYKALSRPKANNQVHNSSDIRFMTENITQNIKEEFAYSDRSKNFKNNNTYLNSVHHFFAQVFFSRFMNKSQRDKKISLEFLCAAIQNFQSPIFMNSLYHAQLGKNVGFVALVALDDLQYITVPTSFSVKNKNHYVLLYHCPDATDRVATESLCIQWAIKKAQEKELTLWALPYCWDKESVSSHGISVTAHNILIKNYFAQTQQRLPFFINSVDKFLFTLSFPVEARLFFVRSLQFESLQKWFQKQGKIMQENFEFVFLTKETLRFYYEELRDCNATFHEANFVPMVLHPQDKNNHIRLFRSFFYNDIDEKNKILIVKERITKRIVGMIYLSTMPQEIKQETTHEHSVYLSNFWIADSYRGKSLGKALIYLMTQKAQEQNPGGFIHTVLCNITGSDSYGFFQKIGLEEKESSIDIIQDLVKEEILVQLQKNC